MVELTKLTALPTTDALASMFKALANPNRLKIFDLVRQGVGTCCTVDELGERCSCVCDIAEHMNLALSTVSHHLKELRSAGLIRCEKRGQWVYCAVNPEALDTLADFLEG